MYRYSRDAVPTIESNCRLGEERWRESDNIDISREARSLLADEYMGVGWLSRRVYYNAIGVGFLERDPMTVLSGRVL